MPSPPYLELQKVTKRFGKNLVLDGMNLSIPFGEITGIIGVSGSGKTTLLNLLIGFYKPTAGKIKFQSRDIIQDHTNVSTIFGFASQGGSFYDELTVEENLRYFGKLYNLKTKEIKIRTDELLKLLELEHARKFLGRSLSTGMQRRLDIACALIHGPKVLILDEPTEDLDPLLRREVINILRKIQKSGTTIILSSHLLGEIESLCDKIAILSNGKILKFDSPANLKKLYSKNTLEEVFIMIVKESQTSVATGILTSALEKNQSKLNNLKSKNQKQSQSTVIRDLFQKLRFWERK